MRLRVAMMIVLTTGCRQRTGVGDVTNKIKTLIF